MAKKISIVDIFNRMSCNDSESEDTNDKKIRELYPTLKKDDRVKNLRSAIETAINAKIGFSRGENAHDRALVLLEIGTRLSKEANKLSQLQDFREKDYSLLIDYFNYYSKICYRVGRNFTTNDCVLIVLKSDVPCFVLGSIISAAFGALCPVIVLYSIENPWFLYFLKQVFSQVIPADFFLLIPKSIYDDDLSVPLDKMVLLGDHATARDLYENTWWTFFSFVNPNQTATIIFEFCDLSAAVDKIFYETWDKKLATIWGVSTAVVQESIYHKFLDSLKLRIDQLTDEQERVLIKNCIISEEDQNREVKPNAPVLKVFSCRTANEGVNFLNSYQYYLGTSIWSENSSQALEVASKLICKNVWINCHGMVEPSIPFQSSDNNGREVFGGSAVIFEYGQSLPGNLSVPRDIDSQKIQVEDIVVSAENAFNKWVLMENKGMYLTRIAESLKNLDNTEISDLSKVVINVLSVEYTNPVPRTCNRNCYIIHETSPIGVIAMVLEDFNLTELVYLITTVIATGNAVVLTIRESPDTPFVRLLVDVFNSHLPRCLLGVIVDNEEYSARISLASNPIIQALWLYPKDLFDRGQLLSIKKSSSKTLKRIWFVPNYFEDFHSHIFVCQTECLRSKIIWLTKGDHFPTSDTSITPSPMFPTTSAHPSTMKRRMYNEAKLPLLHNLISGIVLG